MLKYCSTRYKTLLYFLAKYLIFAIIFGTRITSWWSKLKFFFEACKFRNGTVTQTVFQVPSMLQYHF